MATPGHKGFYVSWQSGSQQVAIVVAALLGFAINKWLMPEQVVAWGWRIPFFIGCLIVPFIFVIRRSLQETEEFLNRKHRPNTSEMMRSIVDNWRIVLAGVLLVIMTTVSFYLITIYTPSYGQERSQACPRPMVCWLRFASGFRISSGCQSWARYRTASDAGPS